MNLMTWLALTGAPALLVGGAYAQPAGFCPATGTVFEGTSGRGGYVTTAKGADAKDPTLCLRVTEGPAAGVNHGKQIAVMYGWYQADYFTAEQIAKVRSELGAVISGSKSQTSFEITVNRPGTSYVWTDAVTWTRVGKETLTIGGRPVETVRFSYRDIGGAGSSRYDALWTLWYDPITHIWVKGDKSDSGGPSLPSFLVTSIRSP